MRPSANARTESTGGRPRRLRTYLRPAERPARGPRAVALLTPEEQLRQECWTVAGLAAMLSLCVLAYCVPRNLLLLYGDAVAHINIARRVTDSLVPGFRQLGSVWLPLPHLLLLPLVQNTTLWQTGLAGAPPSMIAYVLGTVGIYRLARFALQPAPSMLAAAFYALNPGLAYMGVTAMTEPLFLCEMIWIAVVLVSLQRELESGVAGPHAAALQTAAPPRDMGHPERSEGSAVASAPPARERRLLLSLGLLLFAAVFTRYDGWVYAALAWCFAAYRMLRAPGGLRRASGGAFLATTALTLAAPWMWLCYNAKQFHDPLDFLRGPYSAAAIDRRTTPPGAGHYPGWHNWHMAGHYFLKAAELGAAPSLSWLPLGNVLLVASLAGVYVALRRRTLRTAFALFWLPLAFYSYSVAYGSVPIFIPTWEPHSYYNTRYGMELLPAFALGCAFALSGAQGWAARRAPEWRSALAAAAFLAVAVNGTLLLRAQPIVYREALVNSRTRISFESALARALEALPPYGRILMSTSEHPGALEQAAIPFKRTINDGDWLLWQRALQNPAAAAPFVVALEGDPLAHAIAAHPGGLTTLDVICTMGQPCAHLYVATAVLSPGSLQQAAPAKSERNP
jgi:hypothetical protein